MKNMNNSKKPSWIQKIIPAKVTHIIKKVFPNLSFELPIILFVLTTVIFASVLSGTAIFSDELDLMKFESSESQIYFEGEGAIEDEEFVVGGSEEITNDEPIVIEYPVSRMCFIGDSRVVQMSSTVVTEAQFIAKGSQGLKWFKDTAKVQFNEIRDNVDICIVALGINDINNAEDYIEELNLFAEHNSDKILVYVNVGPVDENKYKGIPNSRIEEFNQTLANGLSDRWKIADQYTYLSAEGFESGDGLHYSRGDSAKIFMWLVDSVKTQTLTTIN